MTPSVNPSDILNIISTSVSLINIVKDIKKSHANNKLSELIHELKKLKKDKIDINHVIKAIEIVAESNKCHYFEFEKKKIFGIYEKEIRRIKLC
jgi:hypothetical protein